MRIAIRFFLLPALLAICSTTEFVNADEWVNTRINTDTTSQLQNEQQIVANPTNPLNLVAVWRDFRLGYRQVGYGYSFDGGLTWTNPGLFVDPHYPRDSDPALTVSTDGVFYAMLLAYTGDTYESNGMLMYRSLDGGVTWEDRGFAVDGVQGVFEDKEFIACDRTNSFFSDRIYMVWARFYDADIMCTATGNEGDSWTTAVTVSDESSNQFPTPAVGPEGTLYVAWTSYNESAIKFDRSGNGGTGFGTDLTVTSLYNPHPTLNGGIESPGHPAMDVDITGGEFNGRIYVAYLSREGSGDYDIFIRHSDNHGNSWSSSRRINDDPFNNGKDQFHPWLTVDNMGIVSVVWLDRRQDSLNRQWHCYVSQSFDGGMTWTPNQQVSTAPSDPSGTLTKTERLNAEADREYKMSRGPKLPGPVRRALRNADENTALPTDLVSRYPANADEAKGRSGYTPRPDQAPRRAGTIGEYIGIASSDGFISVVWTDTRHGNQDTYGGSQNLVSAVDETPAELATPHLRLAPNPATGPVTFQYKLPVDGWVKLDIFDVSGRQVKTLVDRNQRSGQREFVWDGTDQGGVKVSPGSYYLRLQAPGIEESRSLRVR
jgi:FlgD Ig-like domain